jgi:hypothetical protein
MMASSRTCCKRRRGLELAAVSEQCPDDVDQAPGERDERLDVVGRLPLPAS